MREDGVAVAAAIMGSHALNDESAVAVCGVAVEEYRPIGYRRNDGCSIIGELGAANQTVVPPAVYLTPTASFSSSLVWAT